MSDKYSCLNRASLSFDYLHTNSTTHDFLFGAIVELVDNSRDANASSIHIKNEKIKDERANQMLVFMDNGSGMLPVEARKVMTLGFSSKKLSANTIGHYGNGLKSGAMRIGRDFILFTKKEDILTCVFVSRTFHEQEHLLDDVIVPSPSFTLAGDPFHPDGESAEEREKLDIEMELIFKFSPFKDKQTIMDQFRKIDGKTGTIVCVFNLKMLDTGEPELDVNTDKLDIRMNNPDSRDEKLVPERISLRAYLAIVYKDPHMKIFINDEKVTTKRILSCLLKPMRYEYTAKNFKSRAEAEIAKVEQNLERAKNILADERDKYGKWKNTPEYRLVSQVSRRTDRIKSEAVRVAEEQLASVERQLADKHKNKNKPRPLTFYFGLNIENRSHDGAMIYNNGRLINMRGLGVMAVVDVPFDVLEPTHNKQMFADAREYRSLMHALGEHMESYWKEINLVDTPGGVQRWWEQFGYGSSMHAPPKQTDEFRHRRQGYVHPCIQCDKCLKWRVIPAQRSKVCEFPSDWVCEMNMDQSQNDCTRPEKFPSVPIKVFKKAQMPDEKKRQKAEAEMKKHAAVLEAIEQKKEAERKKKQAQTVPDRRMSGRPPSASVSAAKTTQQFTARKVVGGMSIRKRPSGPYPAKAARNGRDPSSSSEESESESEMEDKKANSSSAASSAKRAKTKAELQAQQKREAAAKSKRNSAAEVQTARMRPPRAKTPPKSPARQSTSRASSNSAKKPVPTIAAGSKHRVQIEDSGSDTDQEQVQQPPTKRDKPSPTKPRSPVAAASSNVARGGFDVGAKNSPLRTKMSTPPRNRQVAIVAAVGQGPLNTSNDSGASTVSIPIGAEASNIRSPNYSQDTTIECDSLIPTVNGNGTASSESSAGVSSAELQTVMANKAAFVKLVRRMFRQFCPPSYKLNRDEFANMTETQLLAVDMDDFTKFWKEQLNTMIATKTEHNMHQSVNGVKQILQLLNLNIIQGETLDQMVSRIHVRLSGV